MVSLTRSQTIEVKGHGGKNYQDQNIVPADLRPRGDHLMAVVLIGTPTRAIAEVRLPILDPDMTMVMPRVGHEWIDQALHHLLILPVIASENL